MSIFSTKYQLVWKNARILGGKFRIYRTKLVVSGEWWEVSGERYVLENEMQEKHESKKQESKMQEARE